MNHQESFWQGEFGDDYTDRNNDTRHKHYNTFFWRTILGRTGPLQSAIELGCNRGLNLDELKSICPSTSLSAVEINSKAAKISLSKGHNVKNQSIHDTIGFEPAQLVFTCGVLNHINPDMLQDVYSKLYDLSSQYIMIAEYFSPFPVEVSYRGHQETLYKRDFAHEIWTRYPDLKLVDYGFTWRYDPIAPSDDVNWFIFRKS